MAKKNTENAETIEDYSNLQRIAAALHLLEAVEPPATSDEVKAIKAESDKLSKAREALAAAGLDTTEVDAKIEALSTEESAADAGRTELVAALAHVERFTKILGQRCSGARVESIREKYAEMIESGVPEFPGAVEMRTLANGKQRAVHGSRANQIVTALLHMSENGTKRVSIEEMADRLYDVDPSYGDLESTAQQCRTVLQNFADVWTSANSFVFSKN